MMTREETLAYYEIPSTREGVLSQFDHFYRTTGFRPAITSIKPLAQHDLTVEQLQDLLVGMYDAHHEYEEDFKSWLHRQ